MGNLVTNVHEILADKSNELWLPGLARMLVAEREARLPFEAREYSTSRFLGIGEPINICDIAAKSAGPLSLRLENMAKTGNQRFADRGLKFVDDGRISEATYQVISAAISLICLVPSLALTVNTIVRSLHVLQSDDPSIDISFSDPAIPFSIFLSVSQGMNADIRIAEAIIHETMHLQLSLVEQVVPIVLDDTIMRYSPWKQRPRPLSGLIHALYVFRVIDIWLGRISSSNFSMPGISRRRAQIAEEIAELDMTGTVEGFTEQGLVLMSRLVLTSDSSC